MLLKNSLWSYGIIILLAAVLILSVNATAQTKDNKLISNVKPQEALSSSLVLSKKISELEGELSRTKITLFAEQQDGDELFNKIRILTSSMKNLQAVVNEKNTELVVLKDAHETYKDVITCYKTALSAWDNLLNARTRTGPDRITIATELRNAISKCPSI